MMATAILDLELTGLPASIPVPGEYGHALVLVRFNGEPVGQVRLPVQDGRIGDDSVPLPVELARDCDAVLWRRWAEVKFGAGPPQPDHLPSVTTAVCTRDRPDDLERCLQAISRLDPQPDAVIVVDNAPSSDATRLLVAQHPDVRYVREDRPGLDAARNLALREAATEIVAFTDDDAMPDPRWLGALLPNFRDPGVLCVTGLTLAAELETEAQEVFEAASGFGRGFRRRTFSWLNQNPFAVGAVGAGVNMALRRNVITLVGEFDEDLDAGTPTRSGGDHAMFTAILTAGYEIVYEPRALTRHRHRRSRKELLDAIHGYGVGVYAAWTRALLRDGEWAVLPLAFRWFAGEQLPALLGGLAGRPRRTPPDLAWAELRGCVRGPLAYLRSRRRTRGASA